VKTSSLPIGCCLGATRLPKATRAMTLLLTLLPALAGCDGATPATPSPEPTPALAPPPSPTLAVFTETGTVSASNAGVPGVYRFDVAMSHSGNATVTLRWPNGDFSLRLYVTRGGCADTTSLVTGGCTILGTTRPGTLPGVITSPVVIGDQITVWVLNSDPDPQTFNVDVEIK
jgi:hypothetical protein